MDINLSGQMDGVSAARYIFQLSSTDRLPDALADDKLIERAKQSQPLGYILKPSRTGISHRT